MWYSFYYTTYDPKAECFSVCETREKAIQLLVSKAFLSNQYIHLWEDQEMYDEKSRAVTRYSKTIPNFWDIIKGCNSYDEYYLRLKDYYINELCEEAYKELCEDDTIEVVVAQN